MTKGPDARTALLATLVENAEIARMSPSPFYATLLERMGEDVRAGGPWWRLLEPYAHEPATEYFPFRALAGVHLEVLGGERPELAAHFRRSVATATRRRRGRACATSSPGTTPSC